MPIAISLMMPVDSAAWQGPQAISSCVKHLVAAGLFLCAIGASGCGVSSDGNPWNLVQAFAETYRDVDPGVSVQVAGGGSGLELRA